MRTIAFEVGISKAKNACYKFLGLLIKRDIILKKNYILLFKSLRNSKKLNKGNFTSKSNSNKIMLCGGWGQHCFK